MDIIIIIIITGRDEFHLGKLSALPAICDSGIRGANHRLSYQQLPGPHGGLTGRFVSPQQACQTRLFIRTTLRAENIEGGRSKNIFSTY
jgi:hypothetical protein